MALASGRYWTRTNDLHDVNVGSFHFLACFYVFNCEFVRIIGQNFTKNFTEEKQEKCQYDLKDGMTSTNDGNFKSNFSGSMSTVATT